GGAGVARGRLLARIGPFDAARRGTSNDPDRIHRVVCERKNDLPFGARQDRLDQLASAGAIDAGAVKSAVDALEVFGRVVEPQQAKDELNRALLLVGEQSNQERLRFRTTG